MNETLSGPDLRHGVPLSAIADGAMMRFDAVPFFWTEQYDFGLAYIGHAERWDQAELDGRLDVDTRDCTVTYSHSGRKLAVAVVHRDLEGVRAEVEFERSMAAQM